MGLAAARSGGSPHAACVAPANGDVRSSRAAELRDGDGADVLMAALASENDEDEGG